MNTGLQREVWDWLTEVMARLGGEPDRPITLLTKMLEEVKELYDAALERRMRDIPDEAADVAICLMLVCSSLGINLEEAIRKKHAINLAREWKLNSNGTISHIKEEK